MARMPTLGGQSASLAMRTITQGIKKGADGEAVFDVTERRHVRFNLFEPHWRFLKEAFEGGPEFLYKGIGTQRPSGQAISLEDVNQRNLFQYFKEGDDEYRDRLYRAHRVNYSRRVVGQLGSFLNKKPPTRRVEAASDIIQRFWKNTDGRDIKIDEFMSNVRQWMLSLGIVWVSVDRPNVVFDTRADEVERGMPFAKVWFPFDILDGGFDDIGKLKWILVREWKRLDDSPLAPSPVVSVFTAWDREGWVSYVQTKQDADNPTFPYQEIDRGEHNLGFVPFHPVRLSEDSYYPFVGQGVLDDVAYLDRSVFNLQSQLDTIINDQTFSQLAIPADSLTLNSPDRMEGKDGVLVNQETVRRRMVEMGTKRVFLFNGQSTHPPRFISPDASQADIIRVLIKDRVDEIYRITGLLEQAGREVKTQSGTSKAYDFDRINKMLAIAAERLEAVEMWVVRTTEAWMARTSPRKTPDDLVQYPNTFDVMGLLELLDITGRADEVDLWSATLSGKQRERVLESMEPNLSPDIRKKVLAEIEERAERERKMAKLQPIDPFADPRAGANGEPSQTRGEGGGARGPGNSIPTRPVKSTADRADGGNKENERDSDR